MVKIIKRIDDYSEEFKEYCKLHSFSYDLFHCMYKSWAISKRENELFFFIYNTGEDNIVKVTGTVYIDNERHTLKPKILSLFEAFNQILTPDIKDYIVIQSAMGNYYVLAYHDRGHNVFKIYNDKNTKTTTSN